MNSARCRLILAGLGDLESSKWQFWTIGTVVVIMLQFRSSRVELSFKLNRLKIVHSLSNIFAPGCIVFDMICGNDIFVYFYVCCVSCSGDCTGLRGPRSRSALPVARHKRSSSFPLCNYFIGSVVSYDPSDFLRLDVIENKIIVYGCTKTLTK